MTIWIITGILAIAAAAYLLDMPRFWRHYAGGHASKKSKQHVAKQSA